MLKGIKFIIACLLSFTIIYVGVGVNLIPSCCARCEQAKTGDMESGGHYDFKNEPICKSCCAHNVSRQNDKLSIRQRTDCCKTTLYKVDLTKDSQQTPLDMPMAMLLPQKVVLAERGVYSTIDCISLLIDPPRPVSSRYYLNLYSTLLI